ncbi:MAG: 50S ribosomal protein L18 [Candidatus Micrarchaeaceae archaeon]
MGNLKFKRRREFKTNYRKRVKIVKGMMKRIVVRRTNRQIIAQVVQYKGNGDLILSQLNSKALNSLGWPSRPNRPTAYLLGTLLAKKIKEKSISGPFILDIGLNTPSKNSIPFVLGKALKDEGIDIRMNMEVDEELAKGKKIEEYAKKLKESEPEKYKRLFSKYIEEGKEPVFLSQLFEEVRKKIG